MNRRRSFAAPDALTWPEFDDTALAADHRRVFKSRRLAVELYLSGETLAEIERKTGARCNHVHRFLERCLATHEDARIWGWRALVPYARIAAYERAAPVALTEDGDGAAGAFRRLLQDHPALERWIADAVRRKRVVLDQLSTDDGLRTRLRKLKPLHIEFIKQCRAMGLTAVDYPLSAERMGIRSLAAAVRTEALRSFGRGARLAGARAVKGMPTDRVRVARARRPLDVVEFDGHRLDVRLTVVIRDPLGFEQRFEIERLWLLVIIDVCSRAVLGYHVSLNREYSRYDVIRTIEAALEPHRPKAFTLPGVGYGQQGGFPSGRFPEMSYATWQWIKLDNAKANLAEDVRHALAEFLGCYIDAGPPHAPDDRPYIERFFGTIASTLSSRLPGFTGSNPRDVRRALADPRGNTRLFVSLDEIEELLEASLGVYNATPHDGLNGRTPLEAIERGIRGQGAMLNWLPEAKRRTLCLMQTPKWARVRGYLHQGQRPHINFHGVRYTNQMLASTATFLGQALRVYYNSQDLRTVRAFTADGAELGVLKAQGAWGEIAHDLKLRQKIVRLRGRKRLESALSHEFLEQFVADKIARARKGRRQASDLTRTLRALAAAPTAVTMLSTPAQPSAKMDAPPVDPVADPARAPKQRVEPEKLSIGTGYVGTL